MKIKNKKLLRSSIILSPIAVSIVGVATYYIVKKNHNETNYSERPERIGISTQKHNKDPLKIFPEINSFDFYDEIRIKNDVPVISDKFIASVLNEIILKTKYTTGVIRWDVEKVSPQKVVINLMWDPNNSGKDHNGDGQKPVWQNYTLLVTNNI